MSDYDRHKAARLAAQLVDKKKQLEELKLAATLQRLSKGSG